MPRVHRRGASSTLLSLLASASPFAVSAACSCGGTAASVVANVSLERCVQRCRDSVGGCSRAEHFSQGGCCALGVGPEGCGAGWTAATPAADACGFGEGKAQLGGSCASCGAGTASHADLGDLAGIWRLKDSSGSSAGSLKVGAGGEAAYSTGVKGQFLLWHPRADAKYSGAFFLQHRAENAGVEPGWDYAWLEDMVDGSRIAPRLVVRRFCGAAAGGSAKCAPPQRSSPEGSSFFEDSFTGEREAGAAVVGSPCDLLEGQGGNNEPDGCCAAAIATVEVLKQAFSMSVYVSSSRTRWDSLPLINATWNGGAVFQNATLAFSSENAELCEGVAPGLTGGIAVARRGSCVFAQKSQTAYDAGAKGLVLVNLPSQPMPEFIKNSEGATSNPPIPTWMIDAVKGEEVLAALTQGSGATIQVGRWRAFSDASLQALCCASSCRARVEGAAAEGRAGGINTADVCAAANCVSAQPTPAPASAVLPRADSTSCAPCPAGLAASVPGRAHCAPCGDGYEASGTGCSACPTGTAGLGGTCAACGAGFVPDGLRQSCVAAPTLPPTPAPTPKPTCPVCAPINTCPPAQILIREASSGFNWGALFGSSFLISAVCGLGWLLRKMHASYQETGTVDTLAILRSAFCGGSLLALPAAMMAAATVGRPAAKSGEKKEEEEREDPEEPPEKEQKPKGGRRREEEEEEPQQQPRRKKQSNEDEEFGGGKGRRSAPLDDEEPEAGTRRSRSGRRERD